MAIYHSRAENVFEALQVPRVWERMAGDTVPQKELFSSAGLKKWPQIFINAEPWLCLVLRRGIFSGVVV